jgi:endonuclease/exonuclease/phosphatase family metal-dependent hydrolase
MVTLPDQLLEARADAGRAWHHVAARSAGALMALPGLTWLQPVSRRIGAVTREAGRVTVVSGPLGATPCASPLTVVSANLWHDWPRQQRWPERLEAFAELIESEDADVILLQEVARTPKLKADIWLAERLGMSLVYARANGDLDAVGFEEGVAILSRYPIGDLQLRQLSHGRNPFVRRVALGGRVDTPHGHLLVVSVHLGLVRHHNAGQIRRLRSWVRDISHGEVAVIGGDFNASEDQREIEHTSRTWTDTFRATRPHDEAATHTKSRPGRQNLHRRLDYIFVQQPPTACWTVLESSHLDAPSGPHSDHRAVLTRLLPVDIN